MRCAQVMMRAPFVTIIASGVVAQWAWLSAEECDPPPRCECEDAGWTWILHDYGCGGSHMQIFFESEAECENEAELMCAIP
jgi:hypothetical protein